MSGCWCCSIIVLYCTGAGGVRLGCDAEVKATISRKADGGHGCRERNALELSSHDSQMLSNMEEGMVRRHCRAAQPCISSHLQYCPHGYRPHL